ncbi:MAG: glycosyltransferase family 2 protein [Flavobacteriales bacterium]|nr:glycosyltransferase family 2 protein [Flavobacteriales bacterium]
MIIPCRNEAEHIEAMLTSVLDQQLGNLEIEVIVADGMSDDGTTEKLTEFCSRHSNVRWIENPHLVVPHGLNRAIRESRGEVIVRMDAHSVYPPNYIARLVEVLMDENADNTGGVWDTHPGANTSMARSIVFATSSRFGIGNAQYRLGGSGIDEVDTVPFGCYKREVFDRIGLFDEDMVRNQDDELNARLKRAGGKILLVRDVRITYFARPTLSKLNKMFYQYGLFKPLVAKKVGQPATWRQFVPVAFVLFNILVPLLGFVNPWFWWIWIAGNLAHVCVGLILGISYALKSGNAAGIIQVPLIIYVMHWSYGWGYLVGIVQFIVLRQSTNKVSISR